MASSLMNKAHWNSLCYQKPSKIHFNFNSTQSPNTVLINILYKCYCIVMMPVSVLYMASHVSKHPYMRIASSFVLVNFRVKSQTFYPTPLSHHITWSCLVDWGG